MADAEHIKLDDGSVIDVADAVARQKVGSAELQTTAKDCSGAINELKGTLEFKAGDTYSLYFGNGYTVIPARLGWNRARCIMSFSLPKNIPNDLNVGITAFPSEGTIYKESSAYAYTNASVYAVSKRGNIVTITFTFTPSTSLSGSDCSAIVELFNGTLTFSFTS